MKDFNFYSLVSILIAVSWLILKFCYEPSRVRHIQGPMRFPIIGSAWIFVGKSPSQLFSTLKETCEKYEKIFKIYVGGQLDIVLNDPQDVEVLLTDTALMEKAVEYGPIKEWLGDGLLISSGKKWHARRKILTSAFHFNILEEFTEVFTSNSDILIAKLSNFKDNVIDVFPLITLYALDVICETSMGVKINAQLYQDSDYVKAVKEISEIISIRHYNFLMRSDFVFKFTPLYRRQKKVLAKLHGFTENVIKSRRAEYSEIQHHPKSEDEFGRKRKMALLDLLLRSSIEGKMLTDKDIREEVDTFMFEGHDTVTSATCFCLYNLAKNPRVQENVFNEIMNVFGGNFDRKIEIYDLNCLNYLELVIKENLRLYPSVPIFGRKVNESFYLNGKFIPKDAGLGINAYHLGRMSSIWDDPNSFIPERFLNIRKSNSYFTYVPFSAGSRNCIGQKFATLEMKSVIMKIIKNFEISVAEGFEPVLVAELILRSENGVKLKFKKR